jgi:hypothetical protein
MVDDIVDSVLILDVASVSGADRYVVPLKDWCVFFAPPGVPEKGIGVRGFEAHYTAVGFMVSGRTKERTRGREGNDERTDSR